MASSFRNLLAAVAVIVLLSSCSPVRVQHLSLYEYPAQPRGYDMPAYYGEYEGLYVPIAVIDSGPRENVDQADQEAMLAEIKKAARKIGADAVHQVRFITGEGEGMVSDPATPFLSVKQGPYETTYLRAEAIVFPDADRAPEAVQLEMEQE